MVLTEPLTLSIFGSPQKDCFLQNFFGQPSSEKIEGK